MANDKEALNLPAIFSMKKLAELARVDYSKLYHANVGNYNSLSDNDRTRLYNALYSEFEKASASLGFTTDGKRITKA